MALHFMLFGTYHHRLSLEAVPPLPPHRIYTVAVAAVPPRLVWVRPR